MGENPFETPRPLEDSTFKHAGSNVSDLERRLTELEQRVSRSGFLSRNVSRRVVTVWSYFLLGYIIIVAIAAPIIMLVEWLSHRR